MHYSAKDALNNLVCSVVIPGWSHQDKCNLFFKECRKKGVDCIVAPYEADAQLAYLMKAGIAQAIISEDSDLLVYGCQKVGVPV